MSSHLPSFAPKIGCDVVPLDRIAALVAKYGFEKALRRFLTEAELAYCLAAAQPQQRLERAAARIAAKEAVSKALGVGMQGPGYPEGLPWQSIEVLCPQAVLEQCANGTGKPLVRLLDGALAEAQRQSLHHWEVSLAHDGPIALAMVLAY